jgi:hypothetical protein
VEAVDEPDGVGETLSHCNPYGAENPAGHANPYGGLTPATVRESWFCPNPGEVRVRWHCANGHLGETFTVCAQHYAEFMGLREARVNGQRIPIPANIRRDVQTCYRCASLAPECDNPEHAVFYRGRPGRCGCREEKVQVRLVAVS